MADEMEDQTNMIQDQLRMLWHQQERIYQKSIYDYMSHERKQTDVCSNVDSSSSSNGLNKVNSTVSISDVKDIASTHAPPSSAEQNYPFWRQQMFDWSCMVVEGYGLERQVVATSFSLLDRYMCVECRKLYCAPITREDYQLFSMTCLYLSIKIVESFNRKISVQSLVDMSKGYYSQEVIEATERDILKALHWYVNAPTGMDFVRLYSQLWERSNSAAMEATAMRITEMAVADSYLCLQRPSLIGLASLLHAARMEGVETAEMLQFCQNIQAILPFCTDGAEFRRILVRLAKLRYDN